jgi:hypothetical protein
MLTKSLLRCRSFGNLSVITMAGPETEAVERSLKRRRISHGTVTAELATSALSQNHQQGSLALVKSTKVTSQNKIMRDSLNSLCNLDDVFNTISAYSYDYFETFPKIEWKFDDDTNDDFDATVCKSAILHQHQRQQNK